MIRFAAFAAAAGMMSAIVQPAAAQSVTVKVAGKSDAQVQADIRHAAHEVCADGRDFQVGVPEGVEIAQCERITARKAMAQLEQVTIARAASSQVARLTPPVKPDRH